MVKFLSENKRMIFKRSVTNIVEGKIVDYSEDIKLAKKVSKGNEIAWRIIYEKYFESLYQFVFYRIGRHKEDTEDILQEIIFAVAESIENYKGESSLYTWLCGIAKNKILLFFREKGTKQKYEVAMEYLDNEMKIFINNIESDSIPDKILEKQETKDMLGICLSTLPIHYKQVLIEKYFNDGSVKEIAISTVSIV